MDPFVGEIRLFGCNYAPQGWALCQGQLMAISQNTALFSLLGTYYGGDGKTTFALPNLTGRAMLAPGQGPGLSNYNVGQTVGSQAITLTLAQMGGHTHTLPAGGAASTGTPSSTATLSAPPGQGPLRGRDHLCSSECAVRHRRHHGARNRAAGRRRQPAPQQHVPVPCPELLHRPSGYFPIAPVSGPKREAAPVEGGRCSLPETG